MIRPARQFFTLHELLMVTALAALGGMSSTVVSLLGTAVRAALGLPGGLQFLAGLHVLWLVLALGLVGKAGTATVAGLLKGAVELLSGNPHGLLVVMYSGLAGLVADAVWVLLGKRHCRVAYALAGGLSAASNVLILKLVVSLPGHQAVLTGLAVLASISFLSGVVLAGLLGWWLLGALQLAGINGPQLAGSRSARSTEPLPGDRALTNPVRRGTSRVWVATGILGLVVALLATGIYLGRSRAPAAEPNPPSAPLLADSAETSG